MKKIGVIADDVTGGSDVAVAFRRLGIQTSLFFGLPTGIPANSEVNVIALKTRTVDPADAVEQTLAAARLLREAGAELIYFKYCSTFDSSPHGNIGPVLDALADLLDADSVVTTPSSPEHERTMYMGRLFVGELPLAESHMRNHPLTPMTESNIVLLLRAQSRHGVGLLPHKTVAGGRQAIDDALQEARRTGNRFLVADAIDASDLEALGGAVVHQRLVAGAAGLAGGIAHSLAGTDTTERRQSHRMSAGTGAAVVLAGSCSSRTLEQIDYMQRKGRPSFKLDALEEDVPSSLARKALAWYDALDRQDGPLFYSSVPSDELQHVQATVGVARSAEILEESLGLIAQGLAARGVRRFIAAGGETSGSVVDALDIEGGEIGEEAARGVPWIHTSSQVDILLKSGNFGEPELLFSASGQAGDAS